MMLPIAALLLAAAQQPAVTSRYTQLSACDQWAAGEVSERVVEDWIIYRCRGLQHQAVWILYHEGTRMEIGFGSRPNFSGMFEADRDKNWPVEWRGRMVNGRFVAKAAIIRIRGRFDDTKVSDLVVYRLLDDGTSCLVSGSAVTNAEARAMADAPPRPDDCHTTQTPEG